VEDLDLQAVLRRLLQHCEGADAHPPTHTHTYMRARISDKGVRSVVQS
jgi:hypothetical protein